jgi:hypothetical protein
VLEKFSKSPYQLIWLKAYRFQCPARFLVLCEEGGVAAFDFGLAVFLESFL